MTLSPGPNAYVLKGISDLDIKKPSSAFLPSGNGDRVFCDPILPNPGPNSYQVNLDPWTPVRLKRCGSASFVSRSGRESFLSSLSAAPGPGKYSIEGAFKPEVYNIQLGKGDKRFKNLFGTVVYERSAEGEIVSRRDIGGPLSRPPLGKQNESPLNTLHTFGADKERFKDSFYGRLDLQAEIPGPGAYNIRDSTIIPTSVEANRCTSAFRNRSPNRASVLKPPSNRTPGPLYYSPKKCETKPLHQNIDSKWW